MWGVSWEFVALLFGGAGAYFSIVAVLALYFAAINATQRTTQLAIVAANANQRASDAAERAAALETEAAETRLQYETLKAAVAWRLIEPNNIQRLVKRLSERPSVVQLEYVQGDPEAQRLTAQLPVAFREAKWESKIIARVYLGAASGIWILPNATPSDSTRLSVSTVRDAFASIGLGFRSQGGPAAQLVPGETWGPSSPPVKVIVGSKSEPTFP